MAIIKSLMDTDWYILTMAQLFLHKHPEATGKDAFKCRNPEETLFAVNKPSFKTIPKLVDRLEEEIDNFCTLKFKEEELKWLSTFSYFKPDFIDWLEDFRPKRRYIKVIRHSNGWFDIDIDATITQQIWFEVPMLAMLSEVYGEVIIDKDIAFKNGMNCLRRNIDVVSPTPNIRIADFGTRRRYSLEWHTKVVNIFAEKLSEVFVGTSNALLAFKSGYAPIGTMAHKALCAYQQLGHRVIDSQKALFQDWADEYRGDLGIALSDNLGFNQFLKDFDKYFAKLFDGARHDSGDPYMWCEKLIAHYKKFKLEPMHKTGVFSDGLSFYKAVSIYNYFSNKIITSFGIGTKFSNDVGFTPPQIVIKLIECNGAPVAKISDDPGKGMCKDQSYISYINSII